MAISNQILEFENFAKASLPGVLWDFSVLRDHVNSLAETIRDEFPLRAWKAHRDFAVTPAAAKLGSKKSERKRAAALAASKMAAGKIACGVISEARKEASRKNLYWARRAKIRKEWNRLPEASRRELKKLRLRRKLLLQTIDRIAYSNKPGTEERVLKLRTERDELRKKIIEVDARAKPRL